MTVGVDDELRIREYPGDDSATARAVPFKFLSADDLRVVRTNADSSETTLVRGTHYTVAGAGSDNGGNVTPLAPIASGTSWRIEGDMSLAQPTDYTAGDDFPAESHERGLDRSMIAHQEVRRDVNETRARALLVPRGETFGALPAYMARAGFFLSFDANGQPAMASGTGADGALRSDMAAPSGASLLGFKRSASGGAPRALLSKLEDAVSVKDFGAIGDNVLHTVAEWISPGALGRYPSLAALQADYPHVTATTQSIDWAAFMAAFKYATSIGAEVFVPAGYYRINDTLYFGNADYALSFSIRGQNANSTRLYFDNTTPMKNFVFADTNVSYLQISDLEFIETNPRTSRCIYFGDKLDDGIPGWKHLIQNVRISQFKEGVRFDGGPTITDDAYESEVMFLHSKFRNCSLSIVYNNIQAVNHQLIGLDIENDHADDTTEEWPMIVLERGTTVNHVGGSVIGYGSYLKYAYTASNYFQVSSQFSSRGVRMEKRGGNSPVIDQDPATSGISVSNSMRISIEDMPINVSALPANPIFARFGGRTYARFSNVHATRKMTVDGYATANLIANGQSGFIDIVDCRLIEYRRISDQTAYGSAGVSSSEFRGIPVEISTRMEGAQTATVDGHIQPSSEKKTVLSGLLQIAQMKTLVIPKTNTSGIGSGSSDYTYPFQLPLYARPCKFRILRDDVNAGDAFVLSLYAVVGGTDYKVAEITPTAGAGGHFEAHIQTATGLPYFLRDDVNWDGKMKLKKTGTPNGFVGVAMVDFL